MKYLIIHHNMANPNIGTAYESVRTPEPKEYRQIIEGSFQLNGEVVTFGDKDRNVIFCGHTRNVTVIKID